MDDSIFVVESVAAFLAVAMLSLAALRAWNGWLALRREGLSGGNGHRGSSDVAALRERVRRLEAIASGLDA